MSLNKVNNSKSHLSQSSNLVVKIMAVSVQNADITLTVIPGYRMKYGKLPFCSSELQRGNLKFRLLFLVMQHLLCLLCYTVRSVTCNPVSLLSEQQGSLQDV